MTYLVLSRPGVMAGQLHEQSSLVYFQGCGVETGPAPAEQDSPARLTRKGSWHACFLETTILWRALVS